MIINNEFFIGRYLDLDLLINLEKMTSKLTNIITKVSQYLCGLRDSEETMPRRVHRWHTEGGQPAAAETD